ncbi:MAG: hypothetical protein OJF51_001182 [Nitrospira sp.]|nr:MAG: hypothetical protein OJF51_001182 [Nitrospira sp.]
MPSCLCVRQKTQKACGTGALMRGSRIFHHTEKVGEGAQRRSIGRVSAEGSLACTGSPFGSHASEAPCPETLRAIWGQPPSSRSTRLDRVKTMAVTHQGVWYARGNRAIATDVTLAVVRSHRLGDSVAPRVGEGRNTMVRRGWCANPVSDSVMVATALQGGSEHNLSGAETSSTTSQLHSTPDGFCADDARFSFVTPQGARTYHPALRRTRSVGARRTGQGSAPFPALPPPRGRHHRRGTRSSREP